MRVVVLTSSLHGTASRVLPALSDNPEIEIAKVILAQGMSPHRKKTLRTKAKKILKIGLLGAINGIRLRDWYADQDSETLEAVCSRLGLELETTPFINCETTRQLFRDSGADLGLSLGNGYIRKSVFSIPRHGMINVHAEVLPRFQGAQSVIWPIYEGAGSTGFTIHQINRGIDTGKILFQKEFPIEFRPRLRDTVIESLHKTRESIPDAVAFVCANYESLLSRATAQKVGKSYTTPSIWQFMRMTRNNSKMFRNR